MLGYVMEARRDSFKLRRSMLKSVSAVFAACLWANASLAAADIKTIMVESKTMRFPKISLDGADYKSMQFEYAVQGQISIDSTMDLSQTISCNGKPKQNDYIEVRYTGPNVVFRITDLRNQKEILVKHIDTSGTHRIGAGQCDSADSIASFKANTKQWKQNVGQQKISEALTSIQQFMDKDVALSYQDFRFPLFYVSGDGSGFSQFNQGFDLAREAFDTNTQYGLTLEAHDMFLQAIELWEEALADIQQERSSSANEALLLALHRNLSMSYLFVDNFDAARRHDAKAVSKGMPQSDSMQDTILEFEKNQMLSPAVANNMILTLNLWRLGSSIMKYAKLVEVDYADIEHALVKN